MRSPSYLGDGVYAAIDSTGSVVLTLRPGLEVKATILLDKDVWEALLTWAAGYKPEELNVISVPQAVYKEVVKDLQALSSTSPEGGTKLQ
jgi:hypothetical protein